MVENPEITQLKLQLAESKRQLAEATSKAIAQEKAKLEEEIRAVKEALEQVNRNEHLLLADSQLETLRLRYEDAGKWSRHFSESRMHVSSTLLLISLGVLTFSYEKHERMLLWMSAGVWLLMLVFLGYFTCLTWWKSNQQRTLLNTMTGQAKALKKWWAVDFGFITALVLTVPYVIVLVIWIVHPPTG